MAGVFTIAPVLVLALVNTAAPNTWTRLARLSEVSGDVLFGAVALFAAALAYAAAGRGCAFSLPSSRHCPWAGAWPGRSAAPRSTWSRQSGSWC